MSFRAALAAVLIIGSFHGACFGDDSWGEKKGEHFIVYYQRDDSFADEVLRNAESVYHDEIRYFGSLPGQNFWLWDNRAKIYLYDSVNSYLASTHQPEWSNGFADVSRHAIISYEHAQDFLDMVLPHEMAHLIFREFVQVGNKSVPRWLDEGFAISQEKKARGYLDEAIKDAVGDRESIPISDLNRLGALHSTPAKQARLFYAQAQSLAHFLMEGRDGSHFLNFCRSLRDNSDFEEALRKGYQDEFSSVEGLEKKWKKFVMAS